MASSSGKEEREEQFILRVADRQLADRIRKVLRQEADPADQQAAIELLFKESDREGEFVFGTERYGVSVQDLPCVVESYKTYDDINLVKTSDVGQLLLVHDRSAPPASTSGQEALDGVTPPMRDARRRHFRPRIEADPALVPIVEQQLLSILAGCAPQGVEYIDVEEEYVVDADGVGSWRQIVPKKPMKKKQQQVAAQQAAAAVEAGDEEAGDIGGEAAGPSVSVLTGGPTGDEALEHDAETF